MPGAVAELDALGVHPHGRRADRDPLPRRLDRRSRGDARFARGPGRGVRRTVLHDALAERGRRRRRRHRARGPVARVENRGDHVLVDGEPARHLVAADGLHSPVRRLARARRARRRPAPLRAALPRAAGAVDVVRRGALVAAGGGLRDPGRRRPASGWPCSATAGVALRRAARPTSRCCAERLTGRAAAGAAAPGRCASAPRPRSAGRVLLVGDAAGYVDALTGEGIALGLAQARAAVAAVARRRPERYERPGDRLGAAPRRCSPRGCCRRPPTPPCAAGARARRRRGCRGCSAPPSTSSRGRRDGPARTSRWCCSTRTARPSAPPTRRSVHHADTPLHLAFSCYLFDDGGPAAGHPAGAVQARPSPACGPTACCGHPAPGEPIEDAVRRRVRAGARHHARPTCGWCCPRFRYRARDAERRRRERDVPGVRRRPRPTRSRPTPPRSRTRRWEPWAEFREAVLDGSRDVSARGAASRSPSCPPTRCRPRPRTPRTSRPPRRSAGGPEVPRSAVSAPARVTP